MQACSEAFDAVLGLLVDHDHVVTEVTPMAAVFFRYRHAKQAGFACLAPEIAFDLAVFAPLEDALFGRMLLVELAHCIGEDRNLFVFHEFGLRNVQDGHCG